MALEKNSVVDRIEVLENGFVQVRTKTTIMEDGKLLSANFHRHTIAPGADYSQEEQRVQEICAVAQTAEMIASYKAAIAALGI